MIVADAYVNLPLDLYREIDFESIYDVLFKNAKSIAPEYFSDTDFFVAVEPGSVKSWVKGAAYSVPVVWAMIATYGEFKEGLSDISNDSIDFAKRINSVIESVVPLAGSPIYERTHSRDINGIQRITDNIDQIAYFRVKNPDICRREIIKDARKMAKDPVNREILFQLSKCLTESFGSNFSANLPEILSQSDLLVKRRERIRDSASIGTSAARMVDDFHPLDQLFLGTARPVRRAHRIEGAFSV